MTPAVNLPPVLMLPLLLVQIDTDINNTSGK
jgi:hypothetical protein